MRDGRKSKKKMQKGLPPVDPKWWIQTQNKLLVILPTSMRTSPATALKWFIDTQVKGNHHIFSKDELAVNWLFSFCDEAKKHIKPGDESNWTTLYEACLKAQDFPLVPLFGLVLHLWPRAVEPGSRTECCVPGCRQKRSTISSPACADHLCSMCGPLAATEADWEKNYYHICSTYTAYSRDHHRVHIISLDERVIENLRSERARACYRPLKDWCYGVRRTCPNPLGLAACRQDALPSFIRDAPTMDETKVCGQCWPHCRCKYCCTLLIDTTDAHRLASKVCNSSHCNTKLECRRCNRAAFVCRGTILNDIDESLCGPCQKESYFCMTCHRNSNDLRDMMWCNALVWKPSGLKPDYCIRCIPALKKIKGVPFGGGTWIQLRAMMVRLWWDRKAVLSQFDQNMQTRPMEMFQELITKKMDMFSKYLCSREPGNWQVLFETQAMWDCTYMLFIRLLRQPRDIFKKILGFVV
jgi:hypothetical protein